MLGLPSAAIHKTTTAANRGAFAALDRVFSLINCCIVVFPFVGARTAMLGQTGSSRLAFSSDNWRTATNPSMTPSKIAKGLCGAWGLLGEEGNLPHFVN
jgi:hypothetical protein